MAFHADTTFNELRSHFQERVRRHELLANHSAFGVGGLADVWVSLTSKEELVGLVRLCAEVKEQRAGCPLNRGGNKDEHTRRLRE
jgi:hypothetical protein